MYLKETRLRIRGRVTNDMKVRLSIGDFDWRAGDFLRWIGNLYLDGSSKARLPLHGPSQLDFAAALQFQPLRRQRDRISAHQFDGQGRGRYRFLAAIVFDGCNEQHVKFDKRRIRLGAQHDRAGILPHSVFRRTLARPSELQASDFSILQSGVDLQGLNSRALL